MSRCVGHDVTHPGTALQLLTSGADPDSPVDPQKYSRQMAHLIRSYRNELAHGSALLMPNGYPTIELCCDLINQLFASTGESD